MIVLAGSIVSIIQANPEGTMLSLATAGMVPVEDVPLEFGTSHVRSQHLSVVEPSVTAIDVSTVMSGMLVTVLGQNLDVIHSLDCASLVLEGQAQGWLTLRAVTTTVLLSLTCNIITAPGLMLPLPPMTITPTFDLTGRLLRYSK